MEENTYTKYAKHLYPSREGMDVFMAACKAACDALDEYQDTPKTLIRVRYVSAPFPICSVNRQTLLDATWASKIAEKIKNAKDGDEWDKLSNMLPPTNFKQERANIAFVAMMICYYVRHTYSFEEVASEMQSKELTALWINGDSLEVMFDKSFDTFFFNRDTILNRYPCIRTYY